MVLETGVDDGHRIRLCEGVGDGMGEERPWTGTESQKRAEL